MVTEWLAFFKKKELNFFLSIRTSLKTTIWPLTSFMSFMIKNIANRQLKKNQWSQ